MQNEFYKLADHLTTLLEGSELFTCSYSGEDSHFVRFNKSAIRQPGKVSQHEITLDLALGQRHTAGTITLDGDFDADKEKTARLLDELRGRLPHLPEDPHYLYATEVRSTERIQENRLPKAEDAVGQVIDAGKGKDLVGIFASGGIRRGFANSLGQRNWFVSYNFNFDWSFYHSGDKAVKCAYAGFEWDPAAFGRKVAEAEEQLQVLARPPKTIPPGRYRAYLTPVAMVEVLGTLSWGGFGLKAAKTKQSSLLKLIEGEKRLNDAVTITEHTAGGVAPDFQSEGFIRPDTVTLIDKGKHRGYLVSPRSAKEYGVPTNGASSWEWPESLDLAPGDLPREEILERIGTGVWVSNLWYLNYSDRPGGRMTGMTRFATLWVENGEIRDPLNVMRFDETIYRMLGEKLVGLTADAEMILDPMTYGGRATASVRTPGALIDDFTFTL